jgi:hypothetical protein
MSRRQAGAPIDANYIFECSIPEPNSGCWIWLKALAANGYGVLNIDGKTVRAHRASYEVHKHVAVPSSTDVCHTCDIRSCVNPDHLFVGTRADNMQDCAKKGRIRIPGFVGEQLTQSVLTVMFILVWLAIGLIFGPFIGKSNQDDAGG